MRLPTTLFSGLFLMVLVTMSCFIPGDKFDPNRTIEAERVISINPAYKRVDGVCRSFPQPTDSTFVGKARLFNSVGIGYYYRSKEDLNSIERHFTQFLSNDGWSQVENDLLSRVTDFRKGDVLVSVTLGGISSDVTYAVWCTGKDE